MADVKWIKIVTDVFDDDKVLLIESLPDADSIIVIWFKLLCLAGKQNNSGVFMMNGRIAYTEGMFSTIFRRKESTVRLALETFERFGMIEVIDGVVTIPNWGKHQSLEAMENRKNYMKGYMQEYREKQKVITLVASRDKSSDSPIEWRTLKSIFGDECVYCGRKESDTGTLQKDHIVPFGSDGDFVLGNIVPACKNCNRSKNNKSLNEWYPKQTFYNQTRLDTIVEYQNNTDDFLRKHLRKRNVNPPDKIRLDKTREDKTRLEKNIKHKHGEYGHVLLTDEELKKLEVKFTDSGERIRNLDEGIELKGYSYKSHYLAILKWAEKDKTKSDPFAKLMQEVENERN